MPLGVGFWKDLGGFGEGKRAKLAPVRIYFGRINRGRCGGGRGRAQKGMGRIWVDMGALLGPKGFPRGFEKRYYFHVDFNAMLGPCWGQVGTQKRSPKSNPATS